MYLHNKYVHYKPHHEDISPRKVNRFPAFGVYVVGYDVYLCSSELQIVKVNWNWVSVLVGLLGLVLTLSTIYIYAYLTIYT